MEESIGRRGFLIGSLAAALVGCEKPQPKPTNALLPAIPVDQAVNQDELCRKYRIAIAGTYNPQQIRALDDALAKIKSKIDFTAYDLGLTIERTNFSPGEDELEANAARELKRLNNETELYEWLKTKAKGIAKNLDDEKGKEILEKRVIPSLDSVDMKKHREIFEEMINKTPVGKGYTNLGKKLIALEDDLTPEEYGRTLAHELAGHFLTIRSPDFAELHDAFKKINTAAHAALSLKSGRDEQKGIKGIGASYVSRYAYTFDFYSESLKAQMEYKTARLRFVGNMWLGLGIAKQAYPEDKRIVTIYAAYERELKERMDKILDVLPEHEAVVKKWLGNHQEDIAETAAEWILGKLVPATGVASIEQCLDRVREKPETATAIKVWVIEQWYKKAYK